MTIPGTPPSIAAMSQEPVLKDLESMEDVWDAFRLDLIEVESQINKHLQSQAPLINTVANHIFSSGGKRIRPLLLILCARLCGYLPKESLLLGSLIEFIHTATLLHDDVLDEAELRRGQNTARKIWGNQASILVGDYLYSQAMALIATFHDHGINEVLADACKKMAEGEVLQLCANSQPDLSEEDYLKIVEYKTATLVAASCKVGAIVGGASLSEQSALYRFGYHLGMAFQLADDRLDYGADRTKLGKTLGQDLRQGMMTLPLLHLLQTCSSENGRWIREKISAHTIQDEDVEQIIRLMHQQGSLTYATARAREYVEAAALALEPFPPSTAKRSLAITACYMVNRDQ
ncbi:MAG: polyprenyl synthetase family protein [Nitrospirales bacterium]|nr:polyprenyl synthetase family protein [Nitrospirales bacterium]